MSERAATGFLPVLTLGAGAGLDALGERPGWLVHRPPLDLPTRIGRLLWGFSAGDGSAGLSSLAPSEVFHPALRRLVDTLALAGVSGSPEVVVDTVSDQRLRPLLDPVWPDAVIVTADRLATIDLVADRPSAARPTLAVTPPTGAMRDRVVVVLGAARSGTTWLHRMLSAHPDLVGTETGETWLFPDIAPLWADDLRLAIGDDVLVPALREFCDVLLTAMRDRIKPAATHVCEKTPATVWRLPMLAALYPDAHYVHVVRDGRDAVLSMAESGFADGDLAAAARTWVDAVERVRGGATALARFREVRYEQLLTDPVGNVQSLWEWIGLTDPAEPYDDLVERTSQRVTPLQPVGEIGAGKWRSLDRKQRREIEAVAGALLADLGYAG